MQKYTQFRHYFNQLQYNVLQSELSLGVHVRITDMMLSLLIKSQFRISLITYGRTCTYDGYDVVISDSVAVQNIADHSGKGQNMIL